MIERNRTLGPRIIGRDWALGDIVRDRRQVAHNPPARLRFFIWNDCNIDEIAMLQPATAEVAFVDEHNVAPPRNSTIAIIHAVDRRVVLIMASDRRECESFTIGHTRIFIESGINEKIGLLRRCQPLTLRCGNIQPKSTRLLDARIEVCEFRKDRLDCIADLSVIGNHFRPSRIASTASTALWPLLRGGSNPKTRTSPSRSASFGISVMPTVRSPCTFEWPRSGEMPAPLRPILPRSINRLAICCTLPVP